MASLIIIAAFIAAAMALVLLGAILGSLFEIEKLLVRMLEGEGETEAQSPRPWFTRGAQQDEEDPKVNEQKLWEEGVKNLLSYMGQIKGGDKL